MPNSRPKKGLYTLRINEFRLAYELTNDAIIISTIIQPSILRSQINMPLMILMNQVFPRIIDELFKIEPIHSIKNIAGNRTELLITIIPNAVLEITHIMLSNFLRKHYDSFEIRWLGLIEPSPQPSL